MAALKAKYPARSHPMPASVSKGQVTGGGQPFRSKGLLAEFGEGCLTRNWRVLSFGLSYLNGLLPAWFYCVWGTVTTVPLLKTSQREADKLRPVGVKNPLVRTFNRQAAKQNRQVLQRHLEQHQLALSPAGGTSWYTWCGCVWRRTQTGCVSSWMCRMLTTASH